jgi:hypothetical protein
MDEIIANEMLVKENQKNINKINLLQKYMADLVEESIGYKNQLRQINSDLINKDTYNSNKLLPITDLKDTDNSNKLLSITDLKDTDNSNKLLSIILELKESINERFNEINKLFTNQIKRTKNNNESHCVNDNYNNKLGNQPVNKQSNENININMYKLRSDKKSIDYKIQIKKNLKGIYSKKS